MRVTLTLLRRAKIFFGAGVIAQLHVVYSRRERLIFVFGSGPRSRRIVIRGFKRAM